MIELVLYVSMKIKGTSKATSYRGEKPCRSLNIGVGCEKIVFERNYSGKEMVRGSEQGKFKTGRLMAA